LLHLNNECKDTTFDQVELEVIYGHFWGEQQV
jgi:hypothetical protein